MHQISVDIKKRLAVFDIHDEDELNFLQAAANLLIEHQKSYMTKLERDGPVPELEKDRLRLYSELPNYFPWVGPVKLPYKHILAMEDAMNMALIKYEKEVTDNPSDPTVKKYKDFLLLLHKTGRRDLRQNR